MNQLSQAFERVATDNRPAAARFVYLTAAGWGVGDISNDLGIGRPGLTALRAELRAALVENLIADGYTLQEVGNLLGIPIELAETIIK
jgi:hypothetical protein